jgi:cephalosporin-C deacetylase
MKKLPILTLIILYQTSLSAQITIVPDKPSAIYRLTDTARLSIHTVSAERILYRIQRDPTTPILDSATLQLAAGETRVISYKPNDCGFFTISAIGTMGAAKIGFGFNPYDIRPIEPDPADYDAFWVRQKKMLAQVPINPQLSPMPSQATPYSNTYRISIATVENRRVYGYITVPIGVGPFPAVLTLPPFGTVPDLSFPEKSVAEQTGSISISVGIHNVPPDQVDPNAYTPLDPSLREGDYYRLAILAGIRAIDYLFSRPDFDGQNIVTTGASQGAGLALLVAGIDDRVKSCSAGTPAFAEQTGQRYGHSSGFPFFYRNAAATGNQLLSEKTIFNTKYYDPIRALKRYKGPQLLNIGYVDDVTPPETVLSLFNTITGLKILVHCLDLGHSQPDEYWVGRYDFWRKTIPSMRNSVLYYYTNTNTGYYASAGNDTVLPVGARTISLTGRIEYNGVVNTAFPVEWRKAQGEGKVDFSAPNNRQTTATFSKPGIYYLTIYADDDVVFLSDRKRYTVANSIRVVVR